NIGLVRAVRWRANPGLAARALAGGADGTAIVIGIDVAQAVSLADGRRLWRSGLGESDPIIPRNTPVMSPLRLRDGSVVAAGLGTGVTIIGPDGAVRVRHAVTGALRAAPMVFTNHLLGGDQRLALVCDQLLTGPVSGRLTPVRLPNDTLSGVVTLQGELDRILVVADLHGRLIAVEESSGKVLWNEDLGGAEVGPFIAMGSDRIAFLLDGSRLACWQISAGRAQEQWGRALEGQPSGQPV